MKKPNLPEIKKIIKKAHPDIKNLKVTWEKKPFWLDEAGRDFAGWWAIVKLEAEGFRTTIKTATVDTRGRWAGRLMVG